MISSLAIWAKVNVNFSVFAFVPSVGNFFTERAKVVGACADENITFIVYYVFFKYHDKNPFRFCLNEFYYIILFSKNQYELVKGEK